MKALHVLRTIIFVVAALLTAMTTSRAAVAPATMPPPDPAHLHPEVRRMVSELALIVAARDLRALEQHLAADAVISFGGDYGAEGLRTVWEPERTETTLWHELGEILRLGGVEAIDDGVREWRAPYPSFIDIDDPDSDPHGYVVVTGERVALRAAPDPDADVVARVDHAVLAAGCEGTEAWTCIDWNGRMAYVRSDLARFPVGQRITVRVSGSGWTITSFVAGD